MILCKLHVKWQTRLAKEEGHDKQFGYKRLSNKDAKDISFFYEQNKNGDVLEA